MDGRSVLYWLDGPLLYVLVGAGGEDRLRDMARSVYAATASGGAWQRDAGQTLPPAAASQPVAAPLRRSGRRRRPPIRACTVGLALDGAG